MREPLCLVVGVLVPLVLLGLMLWIVWMGGKATDIIVGHKHRTLEELLRSHEVPAAWSRRHQGRLARIRDADRRREAQSRAQADYLRRLDGLIGYVQSTTLVADEETRETLLEELAAIRARWEGRDASEL